jgi:SNF2 family DNA or RNA helicase
MQKIEIWSPHEYQQGGIDWVLEGFERESCSALFLQPGLGKTSVTLEVFRILKENNKINSMLIVAPLRVATQTWPTEIERWLNFCGFSYTVLHGNKKEQLLGNRSDIYLINYEALDWLFSQRQWPHRPKMLVFDELSKMKTWSAKRVKTIRPFLPLFKYRLGLTGTPASNGLHDVFSQVYQLDRGTRFGTRKTNFMNEYFYTNPYNRKILPCNGAVDKIYSKLSTLAYSVDPKGLIKLPDEIHNRIYITFPDKLRALYEQLKEDLVLLLQSGNIIDAKRQAVLSGKLRQFLSGNVYTEGRVVEPIHTEKLDALEELVEELNGSPLLVAYQYNHELDAFKTRFPDAAYIESKTSAKELNRIMKEWNAGITPLLFGHPASIGHGLNMQQASNNICFYTLDFNLENHLQFIKRVARQGQKENSVFIHYLLFKGTIDEYVYSTLDEKNEVQLSLLDFLQGK